MHALMVWALLPMAQLPPHNEAGVTMGHLHLISSDLEGHRKLWVDAMGGVVVKAGPMELFRFPGAVIAVGKGQDRTGTEGSVVNHLGFKVKDLKGTVAKLTAAGATVEREMPETHQVFMLFPDKVRVEFTEDTGQPQPVVHHHIHFFTTNVEEMRAWYVKTFGAKAGRRGRFEAADIPGVNLSFSPSGTKTETTRGRGLDHIGFEVKNLEEFCKNLEANGIKLNVAYRKVPALGVAIAFLTDPWGTYIELTEGFDRL